MSVHQYVVGWIELGVIVGSAALGGYNLRRWLLGGWTGAPARLAEAILTLSVLVIVGEVVGVLGLLQRAPLIVAAVLAGAGITVAARPRIPAGAERLRAPRVDPFQFALALAVAGFIVAQWSLHTQVNLDRGMYGFDTMWYHMPFAAGFLQQGSVTGLHFTDPLYLNWFYPNNSELLHAIPLIAFHRDILSPMLNVGWVALTLLAAWCVGRPYRVGGLSLVAVAIVLGSHTLVSRQPGDAKNDIVAMCFLLSSVAILVNSDGRIFDRDRLGPLIVAGLAAGLALGTKLTLVAPVALLTVGIVYLAPRAWRLGFSGVWLGSVAATGGFWYLRNVVHAISPLPWVKHLGPISLPHPVRIEEGRPPFSVSHYLLNRRVWNDFFLPGLHEAFGRWWEVMLAIAVLGMVLSILFAASRTLRVLGAVGLAATIAYVFTPLTASGPEGSPDGFVLNLRYLAPALVVGAALLPTVPLFARRWWAAWPLAALMVFTLLRTDRPGEIGKSKYETGARLVAVAIVLVPVAVAALRRLRVPRPAVVALGVGLIALGIGLLWPEERDYLNRRYTNAYTKFHLDSGFRWANGQHHQRIALGGTTAAFFQYGYYGLDLSNHVQYLGAHGPHGAFNKIRTCEAWRTAINDGDYRYVVTSPQLNQFTPTSPIFSPEGKWTRNDPAAKLVSKDGYVSVFRITGRLDPSTCKRLERPGTAAAKRSS
jgi:hypothetical protein